MIIGPNWQPNSFTRISHIRIEWHVGGWGEGISWIRCIPSPENKPDWSRKVLSWHTCDSLRLWNYRVPEYKERPIRAPPTLVNYYPVRHCSLNFKRLVSFPWINGEYEFTSENSWVIRVDLEPRRETPLNSITDARKTSVPFVRCGTRVWGICPGMRQ